MTQTMKMGYILLGLSILLCSSPISGQEAKIQHGNVGGYTSARTEGGQDIPGKIDYIKAEKKLLFTPKQDLPKETKFIVKVGSNLKDLGGNKLVDTVNWHFWTSDSPSVVAPTSIATPLIFL